MIEKLEVNHLRTLSALFRFGTMSSAAEHLNVSQQAISLQLKKIRDALGDPLFVRTGHGMVPTPYAKLLEAHVHKVLAAINDIPLPQSMVPSDIERTLVISATDYAQKIIVGGLIGELRAFAPGVKILVTNIESTTLTRKMHEGEISLAFTSAGYVPQGLVSEPLFTERYLCASARRLDAPAGGLPLSRLVAHDFIVVSPGVPSLKGSASTWFEQQGLRRNVVVSVPSFFMAQEYMKQAGLVGFIPSRLLPCEGLFEVPLEKYPPGYEVVAAYHPSARGDALLAWLLDKVRERFAATPRAPLVTDTRPA